MQDSVSSSTDGRKVRPRAVVLGIDGLPWSLIQKLVQNGTMPHLGGLIDQARSGPMNSTRPEISPVAWTSFFTARQPGDHSIFGFTEFNPGQYSLRFNASTDVRSPYVWDWLSLKGGRSIVLNVPLTYPAQPLSGVMVSGFVALDIEKAVFPSRLAAYLSSINYRLEADFDRVHEDRRAFCRDLDLALAGRSKLLDRFWEEDWDLFVLVVTDTDRLLHFFYREYLESGPIVDYFHDFFHRVDQLVGRVHQRVLDIEHGQPLLISLSDHGFAPVKEEFHLNRWLAENGYQAELGPGARALALDPTRIYYNRPPRFAAGRLPAGDIAYLEADIVDRLKQEPAVADVTPGRDIYQGKFTDMAPDLVVHPTIGYEFKAKFDTGPIYAPSPLKGTHTFEDAYYLVHDPDATQAAPPILDIRDLGGLLFSHFQL